MLSCFVSFFLFLFFEKKTEFSPQIVYLVNEIVKTKKKKKNRGFECRAVYTSVVPLANGSKANILQILANDYYECFLFVCLFGCELLRSPREMNFFEFICIRCAELMDASLQILQSSLQDQDSQKVYSCVDLYFVSQVNCFRLLLEENFFSWWLTVFVKYFSSLVCQDGSTFKSKYKFRPYFYAGTKVSTFLYVYLPFISLFLYKKKLNVFHYDSKVKSLSIFSVQEQTEMDVETYLRRRYENQIANVEIMAKEDLDLVRNLAYQQSLEHIVNHCNEFVFLQSLFLFVLKNKGSHIVIVNCLLKISKRFRVQRNEVKENSN